MVKSRKEGTQKIIAIVPSKKRINKKAMNKWSDQEYSILINIVRDYGEDWTRIAKEVPNKTSK